MAKGSLRIIRSRIGAVVGVVFFRGEDLVVKLPRAQIWRRIRSGGEGTYMDEENMLAILLGNWGCRACIETFDHVCGCD